MQPTATKIKRGAGRPRNGPSAAAETGTRFDDETVNSGLTEATGRSYAGRATANDYCFDVTTWHF
jgi:hypothetical protein